MSKISLSDMPKCYFLVSSPRGHRPQIYLSRIWQGRSLDLEYSWTDMLCLLLLLLRP